MLLPLDPTELAADRIEIRASLHGLTLTEKEQFQFLADLSNLDLQAAPGCGKTTLTGLKLCLLASGWSSSLRGVCVLSHTNVAKDQIIEILHKDPDGRRFLRYPHFIGTIQGFIDTFLAKPYLRSKGSDLRAIDDGFFESAALGELRSGNYPQLASLINPPNPRTDLRQITQTAHYVWNNGLDVLGFVNSRRTEFPFGKHTDSYKQLIALKEAVSNRGIFTFHDMYAMAEKYLVEHPKLRVALRRRFPFVLIDEMQDTSREQEQFLNSIFDFEDCVTQRIGDINQRIYSDASDEEPDSAQFPRAAHGNLPKSMRFGAAIAEAASQLTLTASQKLVGNEDRENFAPRILLFEEDCIAQVIPRFAKEVVDYVPATERQHYPVKAVGARKSGTANEFPRNIQSYWPDFNPDPGRARKPGKLIEAVIMTRVNVDYSWKQRSDIIWDACCELLTRWNFKLQNRRPTPRRLIYSIGLPNSVAFLSVKTAILSLNRVDLQNKAAWDEVVAKLQNAFKVALDLPALTDPVAKYCRYDTVSLPTTDATVKCETAWVTVGEEVIGVELATIHAVKGETHSATLALECFHHVHDLEEVLPIMMNQHDPQRLANTLSIAPAVRRTFVAMTRPRNLLAFAVRKSHIEGHLEAFRKAGWQVTDLTES